MQNFTRRSYDQSKNTLDPLDEDPIYEDHSPRALRVVNGGIDPRHMRKGSYIEDDSYAVPLPSQEYGGLPEFPVYTKSGATPDVSRKRDSRDQSAASGRSSGRTGRSGARRSLILGPQPQPQLQSQSPQSASRPRFPVNPSSSGNAEYYRQQQAVQQYQQSQNQSRSSRHLSQSVASPGLGRYSPPLEADEDAEFDEMRARSIMIGFEAPSPSTTNQHTPNGPHFPPVQPQNLAPFHNVGRGSRTSASSTNSAVAGKRGHAASSHYSQVSYVSTIPEEASDYGRNAHNSYASSHVIPSSWGSPVGGLWIPASNEELMSDASSISKGSNKSRGNDYEDFDEGATLVRQASMGRKQKPKLTNVRARSTERSSERSSDRSSEKSSEKSDLRSKSSKSDLTNNSHSHGKRGGSMASLKLEQKMTGKSEKTMMASQPIGNQMEDFDDLQPPPKIGFWQRLSAISTRSNSSDMAPKPLRIPSGKSSPEENYTTMHARKGSQSPSVATGPLGANLSIPQPALNRPRPPRLNIDAVREAEARGSLTSLPELIRRATKLAAVLETGARPDSRWEGSRAPSMMSTDTSNMNGHGHGHGRYQESLSDILASFPPPLASSRRLSSRGTAWPLPGDFAYLQSEETSEIRRKRKICGLPLWAFILLVLLAIVVATAAVILPVQLVALSKDKGKATASITADTCSKTNPCLNGGLASVENGQCMCVCTNEFFGANCAQSNDPACTTMLIQETTSGGPISRNVSLGLAIPRLLGISQSKFSVPIDSATLASTFSSTNTTCALQNALVMLNGRTSPPGTTSDSKINTASSGVALDENVVDFARVAVLYLASTQGMRQAVDARENLGTVFADGQDYGTVGVDSTIAINLTKLSISTDGGKKVVGSPSTKLKHKRSESGISHSHTVRRHKIPGGLV
ncbi:hypothetical protein TWF481_002325 [Arthrobotrys musiformis]|uniref:EGF-like domain-containing protein n=1 Tax=Arthrobotrys musiformis TaxID=47236 RepID=A0AAV9VYX9_9PEZI